MKGTELNKKVLNWLKPMYYKNKTIIFPEHILLATTNSKRKKLKYTTKIIIKSLVFNFLVFKEKIR